MHDYMLLNFLVSELERGFFIGRHKSVRCACEMADVLATCTSSRRWMLMLKSPCASADMVIPVSVKKHSSGEEEAWESQLK